MVRYTPFDGSTAVTPALSLTFVHIRSRAVTIVVNLIKRLGCHHFLGEMSAHVSTRVMKSLRSRFSASSAISKAASSASGDVNTRLPRSLCEKRYKTSRVLAMGLGSCRRSSDAASGIGALAGGCVPMLASEQEAQEGGK
jgi:hypothetical protein